MCCAPFAGRMTAFYPVLLIVFGYLTDFSLAYGGDVSWGCTDGEEYLMCGCEKTCERRSAACGQDCRPGCFCRAGLLRSLDGYCIPPDQCQRPRCAENEEFNPCGSPCAINCTNYHEIFCSQSCKPGCFCKLGHVRGPDGRCINPHDCPITSCGVNEAITDCVNPCNDCADRGHCYYQECKRGCDCLQGYHRNTVGQCILASQCSTGGAACPTNEKFVSCMSHCNDCWHRGQCPNSYCEEGCDCKPGYFRNDYGNCVPEYQCPANSEFCGDHEEYSRCVNPCNNCVSKGSCSGFSCAPGCDCQKGFHRDDSGECVPAEFCDTGDICKEYEEYLLCGSACPLTCENFQQRQACSQRCVRGCFCMAGYVRAVNGSCVLPRDCSPVSRQQCGQNEIFYICKPRCRNTCETFNSPAGPCPTECISGCFCQNGYVRRNDGVCVPPKDCPSNGQIVCPLREIQYQCVPTCQTTCETLNSTEANCNTGCRVGCFCNSGEVRNASGTCIPISNCPARSLSPEDSDDSIVSRRKSYGGARRKANTKAPYRRTRVRKSTIGHIPSTMAAETMLSTPPNTVPTTIPTTMDPTTTESPTSTISTDTPTTENPSTSTTAATETTMISTTESGTSTLMTTVTVTETEPSSSILTTSLQPITYFVTSKKPCHEDSSTQATTTPTDGITESTPTAPTTEITSSSPTNSTEITTVSVQSTQAYAPYAP